MRGTNFKTKGEVSRHTDPLAAHELTHNFHTLIDLIKGYYNGNNREKANAQDAMGFVVRNIEKILEEENSEHRISSVLTRWHLAYYYPRTPLEIVVAMIDKGECKWLYFESKPKISIIESRELAYKWLKSNNYDAQAIEQQTIKGIIDMIKASIRDGGRGLKNLEESGTQSRVKAKIKKELEQERKLLGFTTKF